MPLPSTTDDVLVKAPDGSWKLFRGGKLVDLPKPQTPLPAAPVAPVASIEPVATGPGELVATPVSPLPAPSLSPAASVFVSLPQAPAPVPVPPTPIPAAASQAPVKPVVRSNPVSNRPRVIDIQPPQQLVGPVEELKMSLVDFRGLSDSVDVRLRRIQEKFALLEQESYAKKIEGISSWRASEVYSLYVALGQESIGKGQTIQQAIETRKSANQPTLNFEEFQAVTSLNRELRF